MEDHPRPADTWPLDAAGVVEFPSGRRIRGRGLRRPVPDGPHPLLGIYLLGKGSPRVPWSSLWIDWPDFGLPRDRAAAARILQSAWERSSSERVEVACGGGRGRTGTALACIAVIDGVPPAEAVRYIRERYHRKAVETPWQRRFVERFDGSLAR